MTKEKDEKILISFWEVLKKKKIVLYKGYANVLSKMFALNGNTQRLRPSQSDK